MLDYEMDFEIEQTVMEMDHQSVIAWLEQFGIYTVEEQINESRAFAVLIAHLKANPEHAELVIYD